MTTFLPRQVLTAEALNAAFAEQVAATFTVTGSGAKALNASGTGSFGLPSGSTAQRPDTGAAGTVRYNSTTGRYEFGTGGAWANHVRLAGDTMTGALGVAGSANTITVAGSAAAAPATLAASGTDSNISIRINPKGTGGQVQLWRTVIGDNANSQGVFDGSSSLTVKGNSTLTTTIAPVFQSNASLAGKLTTGNTFVNAISITDNVNTSSHSAKALYGLYVDHHVGSSGTWTGGRTGILSGMTLASAPAAGGVAPGSFFNAVIGTSQCSVNLGGTGTSAQSAGSLEGGVFQAFATGTATFLHQVTGMTASASVGGSASAQFVMAIQIATGDGGGSASYAGITMGADTADVPFRHGIAFGDPITVGWPIDITGTMIGTMRPTPAVGDPAPPRVADFGVDFSDVTFGTAFLKSVGFLVDPVGNTTVLTVKVGANQVVGARDTGWAAMTGTPNKAAVYDTASVTLPQLAGRVAQLQAALTTHGLLGA